MKSLRILLPVAAVMLSSCGKLDICRDRDLQVERADYTGSRLRTDGYYYCPSDTGSDGVVLNEVIIFYRNGVVLFAGDISAGSEELFLHLISGYPEIRSSKASWGTFSILDSLITICKWKPAVCGYPAVKRTGEIKNDTSFIITSMDIKGKYGTGTLAREQNFCFRAYFPKPDSLNDFIE